MAAPKENLLSVGYLTGIEQNTFTKQRQRCVRKSRVMHLKQRLQELKERERTAQQHNRQLLQQFEFAQDTLKEMLVHNAAMKTIRMEYERYLEESSPRWQQQLKEKTQTAQKKRMEDDLRSCIKKTEEERVKNSSADQPLFSQGPAARPHKIAEPQEYSDYNQVGSSHRPYTQTSWLTHTQSQTSRFPVRLPYQPLGSSQVRPSFRPPPIFQYPLPFPLRHLAATSSHHHPWQGQDPPGWASPQPDYPWSWAAGAAGIPSGSEALWGPLFMEEPPPESRVSQLVGEEDKTSKASSSKTERGGGSQSSHLSQELDTKPVRLSGSCAVSSESGRESSAASREKRKKRGRTRHASSGRERCSAQESPRTSSAVLIGSVAVAQSSESDASSEKSRSSSRRTRRSGSLVVGSPTSEQVAKERTRSQGDNADSPSGKSQHTGEELGSSSEESMSEKAGNQTHDDKLESCREKSQKEEEEESGSDSVEIENGVARVIEKQESSSTEEDEEETKKNLGAGEDDEENSKTSEEQEDRDVEGDDDEEVSARQNKTEEEVQTAAVEEMKHQGNEQSNRLENEDASSREEEVDEDESEDEEEDGEDEKEVERRSDEGEPEDRDSEDSIISPQEKRSKPMQIIPEEAAEDDEEESKTGSSSDGSDEFNDEDFENLLTPQEKIKVEKDLKADEKPKAICHNVEIFQVKPSDHPSDSDEFDHFYD